MTYSYISKIKWSSKENVHGTLELDCGYSFDFHKPSEFGGKDELMNPEDAFVGAVAMCYSITFQEMCRKMRLDIEDFELHTEGILEKVNDKMMITKIILSPKVKSRNDNNKIQKALRLAEKNCLITRSINSDIVLKN
ncbi:MAG: OsmC family protein [Thermoplasmata archaeon]